MECALARSLVKILMSLLTFLAVSFCAATDGNAYWADFAGSTLDTTQWSVKYTSGIYPYQNNGLYLSAGGDSEIVSKSRFSSGVFTVEFQGYTSTNLQPEGSRQGAIAGIGIGGTNAQGITKYIRIERDQNGSNGQPVGYFEVNYFVTGMSDVQVRVIPTATSEGKLRMAWDGSTVVLSAFDSTHPELGWQTVFSRGLTFSGPVPVWLFDYDLYGTTSIKMNYLDYQPVPLPPALLLLGPALVSLVAVRRKFKK